MNREEWLMKAVERVRNVFDINQYTLPEKIKISCGFAFGKKKAIGQCWARSLSRGDNTEIFISPFLEKSDEIAPVLIHELIHAAIGPELQHGAEFKCAMKVFGLVGKAKSSEPGPDFFEIFDLSDLGPYPHEKLTIDEKTKDTEDKDKCRQLKAACPSCGYTIRTTKKWIVLGLPTCVCGTVFEMADKEQTDEEEVLDG